MSIICICQLFNAIHQLIITIFHFQACIVEQEKNRSNKKISLMAIDSVSFSNNTFFLKIINTENDNFYIKLNDINANWSENYYANSNNILGNSTIKLIPNTRLGISLWKKKYYLGKKNLLIYWNFKDSFDLNHAEFEILNLKPSKKIKVSFDVDSLLYECCENNLINLSFAPIGVDYFIKDTLAFNVKNGMIYIDDEIYLDSLIIDTLNNKIITYSSDSRLAERHYDIIK